MTFGRQVIAAAMQLLTVILIARNLGPEGNGLYAMAVLLPGILIQLLNFGIGASTVFFIGQGVVTARQAARENLRFACEISMVGAVLALPVLLLWGNKLFPGVSMSLLFIGFLAFPVGLLQSYWITVLQGVEDFRAFNLISLVPPFVMLSGTIIVLLLFNASVMTVLIVHLISQIVGLVQTWLYVRQKGVWDENTTMSVVGYRCRVLGYGWKTYLGNLVAFINYRADIFIVNLFLGPVKTGIYVLAVQMAERLWMLSQAAGTVLYPRFSAMHGNPEERYRLAIKAGIVVGAVTLAGSIVLVAALFFLLEPIFGAAYKATFVPFLWLLPGVVVWAIARMNSNCIAAAGKPEWNLYGVILSTFINILANVLLIPAYGVAGAAVASSLSYGVYGVWSMALVKKTLSVSSYAD
jgi:O-antigen/teichoic acid export membrane protein